MPDKPTNITCGHARCNRPMAPGDGLCAEHRAYVREHGFAAFLDDAVSTTGEKHPARNGNGEGASAPTPAPYRHCGVSMCAGACLECNVANRAERRIAEWLRDQEYFGLADAIERGEHRG